MKKLIVVMVLFLSPHIARAGWGAELPYLAKIVVNTLHTMQELERQTQHMNDELAGIRDKIHRIQTIAELVSPSTWEKWKDPREALNRLRTVYHTMPKEFRNEKYDAIDEELSKAMNLVSRVNSESDTTFRSGKELEHRGADASPGVAQKLTASGIGTLVSLESQSLVVQGQITSLLTQMIAEGNDRETRAIVSRGKNFGSFSKTLSSSDGRFSSQALSTKAGK